MEHENIVERSKKRTVTHTAWTVFGKTVFNKVVTKNRVVHFGAFNYYVACACGKKVHHEKVVCTEILNLVTCKNCIAKLKESNWHCPIHGFIDFKHVTNDEKCEICGSCLNEDRASCAQESPAEQEEVNSNNS